MEILQNYSLRTLNTFGIDAQADWFIPFTSIEDLQLLSRDEYFQECRCITIGEGSNLLFLANFHGIVLHSKILGRQVVAETEETVDMLVGSGVHWDGLVAELVDLGLYGVENLSLIPGQVGAAAIQNIGAYGAEVSQVIQEVHTVNRRSGEVRRFSNQECNYSYRHSIFKEPEWADYIVTHVVLRLSKKPTLHLDYADLRERVTAHTAEPTASDVRREVIHIRQEKLPDPKTLGNAGSFFMNPIISSEAFAELLKAHPNAPHYLLEDGRVKVPAGWLIDRCGLKGYRLGHAGVYEKQALVLVNADGEATGQDIARLAEYIQGEVQQRFGIRIEPEVRYIS
jgi:UDP-N-acetylmuramate dehydrogenase